MMHSLHFHILHSIKGINQSQSLIHQACDLGLIWTLALALIVKVKQYTIN